MITPSAAPPQPRRRHLCAALLASLLVVGCATYRSNASQPRLIPDWLFSFGSDAPVERGLNSTKNDGARSDAGAPRPVSDWLFSFGSGALVERSLNSTEGDGTLDENEFDQFRRSVQLTQDVWLRTSDKSLFSMTDANGDGQIQWEELIRLPEFYHPPPPAAPPGFRARVFDWHLAFIQVDTHTEVCRAQEPCSRIWLLFASV